ncbi:S-adenosyl-L-methionine-dependent methyltransferase [Durotheca rogersii]|uniref:S-adenosyl-L-methionine-dependent methyltransferase n=1 Tax=Durotheca rogersii TaxID=419775 RepID=UPI00221F5BF7|nr:S-adenosyl-L-methionine-dependent methyltransferase [Durotheca rogersii]KAI5867808.1 S-adenosyl-L-methionine-dependent methyltransferase [Durotheca rogersii]
MEVFDFIVDRGPASLPPIDILHVSPPCQVWSPAHTRVGRDDDANLAALFATAQILRALRPRFATAEQTFGIHHARFRAYFHAFIAAFTALDYSVAYRVVNLAEWGVCQPRRRLIVIAAEVGERLPPFPQPTHARDGGPRGRGGRGLPGFLTIRQALRPLEIRERRGAQITLHDVLAASDRAARVPTRFPRPPYDADRPLQRTMTTDGGGNYHPTGTRDFTLREYACIQGFPVGYQFAEPGIRKQIGNAFPPTAVEVLYRHLHQWLREVDGVVGSEREQLGRRPAAADGDLVMLDYDPRLVVAVDDDDDDDDSDDDVVIIDRVSRSRSSSTSSATLSIGSGVGAE